MRKLKLLKSALIVGAMFAFASCGEEPEDPTTGFNVSAPASVLEGLEVSRLNFDGEEYIFSYDANGKLNKVSSTYSESDEWGTWSGESEYSFVYTNGKLSKVEEKGSSSQTPTGGETSTYSKTKTISYTYNADELVSEIKREYVYTQNGQTNGDSWSSTFEYNADKQLVKEVEESSDGTYKEWSTFEWSGRNVVKQAYFEESTSGGRKSAGMRMQEKRPSSILSRMGSKAAELEGEIVYSNFDDKVNSLVIFSVIEGYFGGELISKNNVRKMVEYDTDGNGNLVQDEESILVLEYDSKGRPTKYTITEKDATDSEVDEITITYRN